VLQNSDLETRQLIHQLWNLLGYNGDPSPDHERGMETQGRDKILRLKLPVGKGTVDDLETHGYPLRGFERPSRIARRTAHSAFQGKDDFRFYLECARVRQRETA